MKKIISLIAAVSMFVALSTSAFALTFNPTVETGTLKGTEITTTDAGFTFKVIGVEQVRQATVEIDLTSLINDGWTISPVDGIFGFDTAGSGYDAMVGNKIQVRSTANMKGHDSIGKPFVQFTATPGESSEYANLSFTVKPTVLGMTNTDKYTTQTTYTVVKGTSDKVTTEDTLTDGEGVVEFDYAADYVGNKAFEGKKVIFQNVETTRGNITADTKVKVTRKSTNEVKYFGEKLFEDWGVEGGGELAAKTIAFGLVIDAELDAADFEFVID